MITLYLENCSQETENDEELLIPPPRSPSPEYGADRFGVEARLRSLLDVAEEDFPDEEPDADYGKEVEKVAYVVSGNPRPDPEPVS